VEDLTGDAYGEAFVVLDQGGNELERTLDHTGYTEVYWESSESKAVGVPRLRLAARRRERRPRAGGTGGDLTDPFEELVAGSRPSG
jgi:hypothetical protein